MVINQNKNGSYQILLGYKNASVIDMIIIENVIDIFILTNKLSLIFYYIA